MGDNIGKIVYWTLPYNTVSFTLRWHHLDPKNRDRGVVYYVVYVGLAAGNGHVKHVSSRQIPIGRILDPTKKLMN